MHGWSVAVASRVGMDGWAAAIVVAEAATAAAAVTSRLVAHGAESKEKKIAAHHLT